MQWNDIDYMHDLLDWTYNSAGKYAGLPAVVDDLHSNGQHYVIIIVSDNISNDKPEFEWLVGVSFFLFFFFFFFFVVLFFTSNHD